MDGTGGGMFKREMVWIERGVRRCVCLGNKDVCVGRGVLYVFGCDNLGVCFDREE